MMIQDQPTALADGDRGCGPRLRKAREAAGLSQADVAARLKMPLRVVQSLEQEDWSRLGAPVFVRGQLRSYSRLVGLATETTVGSSGVAPVEPPRLQPRSYTPASHRLAEMVARRFVYIVLTAAIAVPVWLATRTHLGELVHDTAPLDAPALGKVDDGHAGRQATAGAAADRNPGTVVASLASLPPDPPAAAAPGLSLRLDGDSWIEITGRDGSQLEQALLHAGDVRHFERGQVAQVVIGNAEAVQVRQRGEAVDLAPFQRANVARFTVSSDGSLAAAAD